MPPSGEYDEGLLTQAPKLDKRTIQEGYSTDILKEAEKHAQPQSRSNSAVPESSGRQPQRGNSNESAASREALAAHPKALEAQAPPAKPRAFWKTTKGLIIIGAGVVIVIVAAVVGGVVGSRRRGDRDQTGSGGNTGNETGGTGGDSQTGSEGQVPAPGGSDAPIGGDPAATSTSSSGAPLPSFDVPTGLEGIDTTPPDSGGDTGTVGAGDLRTLPQPNLGAVSASSIELTGLD